MTNLKGEAQAIYEDIYCACGEMEKRIKETQLGLFADRTSCHRWWPNQFRLLLSSLAYALLGTIRRVGLAGTELAKAQCTTLRLKLLKIGAVVVRNESGSGCRVAIRIRTCSSWSRVGWRPDKASKCCLRHATNKMGVGG